MAESLASNPVTAAAPTPIRRHSTVPLAFTLIGGFLTCVAVFLPWAIVTSYPGGVNVMTGFDIQNDGIEALALGILTLGFGAAGTRPVVMTFVLRAPLVLGVLIAWLAIAETNNANAWAQYGQTWSTDGNWAHLDIGNGLVFLLLAAVLTFLGGFGRKR